MSALRLLAARIVVAAASSPSCRRIGVASRCGAAHGVVAATRRATGATAMTWHMRRMSACHSSSAVSMQHDNNNDDNDGEGEDDVSEEQRRAGYYRLPEVRQIALDPAVYEVRLARGSGPGGQGANSSSNKVELRVNLARLATTVDARVVAELRRREMGRAVTADGTTLIVAAHEHRSAHYNREACVSKVQELLHAASFVPPADAPPVERASSLITRSKQQRRKKSNMRRLALAARKGAW